ncbi:hypothetical protein Q9L58_009560 [Maublancomyces gigas]|uniref:Uncharacterized protein n=1 Tax=Discina gigas TaxID=1032678 RepID=A0ABR3G6K1_9PEZI
MVGKSWLTLATEFKQPDYEARAIQKFFKSTVNKKMSSLREECGSQYEQVYHADDTLYAYAGKYVTEATPILELLPLLFRDDLAKLVRAQYKDAPMNGIAAGFNECFRSKYQASENPPIFLSSVMLTDREDKDRRTVHVGVGTGGWPRKNKAKPLSDTTNDGDAASSTQEALVPEVSAPEAPVPEAPVPQRQSFRPW